MEKEIQEKTLEVGEQERLEVGEQERLEKGEQERLEDMKEEMLEESFGDEAILMDDCATQEYPRFLFRTPLKNRYRALHLARELTEIVFDNLEKQRSEIRQLQFQNARLVNLMERRAIYEGDELALVMLARIKGIVSDSSDSDNCDTDNGDARNSDALNSDALNSDPDNSDALNSDPDNSEDF
ncbi:hypothetical protein GBF38_004625 [Nibea albiflora]|uniref:Uncharacterized protein n=1 Tax=Nibea albiflora TaxID=240163 RepID=A0ACB7FDE3_NIBAL|nr:hypothetical protein GBF38_004625 [Nibea albiflora]